MRAWPREWAARGVNADRDSRETLLKAIHHCDRLLGLGEPPARLRLKVVVERRVPGKPADKDTQTLQLARLAGSRGTFETILTQTPEGEYRFWLSEPAVKPRPQVECKVLAPPGEMELLRMNQAEMEQAALLTQGKFYTLDTADALVDDLEAGRLQEEIPPHGTLARVRQRTAPNWADTGRRAQDEVDAR